MEALITNIQKFSIHDGAGIRTTVFLKGCPLHCTWCANPEAQNYKNELLHFKEKCKRCLCCVMACPNGAITAGEDGFPIIDRTKCVLCGKCTEACLYDSMRLAAKGYTTEELLKECLKDKAFYGETGGVTLSGGECLSFEPFVMEFIKLCKENGVGVTFESCGCGKAETLIKYSEYAQRIYFDIKHHDPAKFKEVAGGDLNAIVSNLKKLTDVFENTAVRIPVIYGVNDTAEDMEKIAALIKENVGAKGIIFVELLPFHNLGEAKYAALSIPYNFTACANMDKSVVKEFIPIFEKYGFRCIVD